MLELRLTLIVKLLSAACAAAALATMPACPNHECPDWSAPKRYELPEDIDVVAVGLDDYGALRYLVGAGGRIVDLGAGGKVQQAADTELRSVAVTQELLVAVGAGGKVVAAPLGSDAWQMVDIGTTAELWQVASLDSWGHETVIIGDGVMFVHDAANFTWKPIAPPEGGWGDLRAIDRSFEDTLVVVGRGGVVWTADKIAGPWTREDPGTDADLTTLWRGRAGGTDGTLVERASDGTWHRTDLETTADVVSVSGDYTLTSDGKVYEGAVPTPIAELGPGLRVLVAIWSEDVIVLGDAGTHQLIDDRCEYSASGRPLIVDDAASTAAVVVSTDWCAATRPAMEMSEGACDGSVEFWTAAGLAEHASIASFARALLELMSLGAPPELLRETQAALADEIEHAEQCFAQARRRGGVPVGPGPLALDGRALARIGDPVAIALAVFDEGCVAEGVAAAEVALQAEVCRDPETRAVFHKLARDETRHAALAWKTLRWLLDRHGEVVAVPLRRRLARLSAPGGLDSGRREQGLLSLRERAGIRRQVVREVVHPLASALLAGPSRVTEVRS